jgi:hypothetical protein
MMEHRKQTGETAVLSLINALERATPCITEVQALNFSLDIWRL